MWMRLPGWLVVLGLCVVACSPTQESVVVPTQTLIPSTATPTATPVTPTITPQNLPAPEDFEISPTPIAIEPMLPTSLLFDHSLVQNTLTDLATRLGTSEDRLQLGEVRTRIYSTVDLDCSTREQEPPPLEIGYKVSWIGGRQVYTYYTWDDEFIWCDESPLHGDLLVAVDPIAAELTALARRRIQQDSGLELADIEMIDVFAVQWQDSSLGCPQAGQSYSDALIDGYRIIIGEGEQQYLFHTDSVRLVPCDEALESN